MQKESLHFHIYFLWLSLLLLITGCNTKRATVLPFATGTDTAAINKTIRLANILPDPDSSLQLYKATLQKSTDAKYKYGEFQSLLGIGKKYTEKGDYPKSIELYQQALAVAANTVDTANCYKRIAGVYWHTSDFVHASENLYKALDLFEKSKYQGPLVVDAYNLLAVINFQMYQSDKGLAFLKKAEAAASDGKLDLSLANVFHSMSNYYSSINKIDSAKEYLGKEMKIAREYNDIPTIASADIGFGTIFFYGREFDKAIPYLQEVVTLTKDKYIRPFIDASYRLGQCLYVTGKTTEGEAIILSALKEGVAHKMKKDALYGYDALRGIYNKEGRWEKAMQCADSMLAIKDSVTGTDKANAVNQMDIKYKTAEKDKQIAEQNSKIAGQKMWIASISGGVLALLLISFGFYRSSHHKARLQAERIKTLQQENTIGILKGVVQGEENERIRLARDLHDGIGGMLSATKMRFMALRHDNEDLVRSPRYLEAMGLLDIMGDEIRKTSHNLMPEVLLKQNLADALRTYRNNIKSGTDLQIDFQSFGSFDDLPNDFKLNNYRIVQELLKNVLQHAKATYVVVQLMMLEAYLTVSVEDNGTGFDTNETKDGIGLHNLKTRVLSHEGHYTLKSEQGKGTTVYIEFGMPLLKGNPESRIS